MQTKRALVVACLLSVPLLGLVIAQVVEEPEPPTTFRFPVNVPAVTVQNFPNPQNVAGTVNVGNLPAVQAVSIQNPQVEVGGSVTVGNLPLDPQGNLRVTNQSGKTFRFVGVTSATFNGSAGWAQMTQACYAEYPGSRVAFMDEYRTTINPPDVSQTAWIQARPSASENYDSVGNRLGGDPSINGLDCAGWTNPAGSGRGEALQPGGTIWFAPCHLLHGVACAAPE